jgi:hypothetical protein
MTAYELEKAARAARHALEMGGDISRSQATLAALATLLQHEADKAAEARRGKSVETTDGAG